MVRNVDQVAPYEVEKINSVLTGTCNAVLYLL